MLDAQVLPDSIAGRADVLPPASVCSCTEGRLDAAGCMSSVRWTSPRQRNWGGEPVCGGGVLRLSGAMVVAVLIAAVIVDESDAGACGARRARLYATVLAVGCMVSRVVAKSGSRDRSTEDG